jgi:hypothetical protein
VLVRTLEVKSSHQGNKQRHQAQGGGISHQVKDGLSTEGKEKGNKAYQNHRKPGEPKKASVGEVFKHRSQKVFT